MRALAAAVVCVIALVPCAGVRGEMLIFDFEARVTRSFLTDSSFNEFAPPSELAIGTTFSGSYSFEASTPENTNDPNSLFSISIGGLTSTRNRYVVNDNIGGNTDTFAFFSTFRNSSIGSYELDLISHDVIGFQNMLSGEMFPVHLPLSTEILSNELSISLFDYTNDVSGSVAADVTSFTLRNATVPEPTTALTFGGALLLLTRRRRA